MDRLLGGGKLSFDNVNTHAVETLFQSEGYFWLVTALATGLAAEEMEAFFHNEVKRVDTDKIIQLFNQCIRNNDITEAEKKQATVWSMENLKQIDIWNRNIVAFEEKKGLGISKGFTTYWLNYKLIELECQQVLGLEEIEETYQFLNQVLADREELDQIEQACSTNGINDDQRMFLRSHWQNSHLFWTNLYAGLQLFSLGLIEMRQPKVQEG